MTLTNGGSFNDKVNFMARWTRSTRIPGAVQPAPARRRRTGDPEIQAAATANDLDNFMIVFAKKFMNVVLSRMDANADIFKAILDDDAFAKDLQTSYGRDVYRELRIELGPQ